MKKKYQETELKIQLTESMYIHIKNQYAKGYQGVLQKNFFLDTPDNYLLTQKWILRIRIEDNNGYITVKGKGKINNAFYQRPEYESVIPKETALLLLEGFNLNSFDFFPCNELIKRFGNHYIKPFLSFKNLRISFPWKKWEYELDKTTIKEKIFYELEVETSPKEKTNLEKELKVLFNSHGWEYIPSPISKFKRALNLVLNRS